MVVGIFRRQKCIAITRTIKEATAPFQPVIDIPSIVQRKVDRLTNLTLLSLIKNAYNIVTRHMQLPNTLGSSKLLHLLNHHA